MAEPQLESLPPVLTVAQLAAVLRVGRRHSYKLITDGTIRHVRVGRAIRIPKLALIEFLDGDARAAR